MNITEYEERKKEIRTSSRSETAYIKALVEAVEASPSLGPNALLRFKQDVRRSTSTAQMHEGMSMEDLQDLRDRASKQRERQAPEPDGDSNGDDAPSGPEPGP